MREFSIEAELGYCLFGLCDFNDMCETDVVKEKEKTVQTPVVKLSIKTVPRFVTCCKIQYLMLDNCS